MTTFTEAHRQKCDALKQLQSAAQYARTARPEYRAQAEAKVKQFRAKYNRACEVVSQFYQQQETENA